MAARKKSQLGKDEDFYSTLAADFSDEASSGVSDADVAALTKALENMDDMDDALFNSSLKPKKSGSKESVTAATKKKSSSKESLPSPVTSPSPGLARKGTYDISNDLDNDLFKTYDLGKKEVPSPEKTESEKSPGMSKTFPGRSKPKSPSFDFGDFDEDDPLAGLLSDEEDVPKPKKKPAAKSAKVGAAKPSVKDSPVVEKKEPEPTPASSQELLGTSRSEDSLLDDGIGLDTTPRDRGKKKGADTGSKPPAKKKSDDIDFGDDDGILDGLGFDESPRAKPKRSSKVDEEQQAAKAKVNDLFGKTSILDKPPSSKGRTREFQLDTKYKKPQAVAKEPTEDDFTFGGYTPSSVISKRPDSAPPARRGVRFADEDGDDIFGNSTMDHPRRGGGLSRPSSSPASPKKTTKSEADSDDWLNEAVGLSAPYGKKKQEPVSGASKQAEPGPKTSLPPSQATSKAAGNAKQDPGPGGGGLKKDPGGAKKPPSAADYLGLGGDDIDVNSLAPAKQITPRDSRDDLFTPPAKRDTTSPFPWDSDGAGRRRRNPDLSSTGDLGSTFDSLNYSDDDDDGDTDALGESDPLRASLIAQQLKQLAAMEKGETLPKERTPSTVPSGTTSKPPAATSRPPSTSTSNTGQLTPQSSQVENGSTRGGRAPLQRQASLTSPPIDEKPAGPSPLPTSGRREPRWKQEMRQQQQLLQQTQQSPSNAAVAPPPPQQPPITTATPASTTLPPPPAAGSGMPHVAPAAQSPLVSTETQKQLEQQRQSMAEFEQSLQEQQAQMAAEHAKQMQLIQEQRQKAMLQQQQQAIQQQQEAMKQQQAMMQQQQQQQLLQATGPHPLPGVAGMGVAPGMMGVAGVGFGGGASATPSASLGMGAVSMQNPWLENKVRQLELEKSQLESQLQFSDKQHKQQLAAMETGHQEYVSLLEESSRRRDERLRQDGDEAARRYEERLQALLAERSKVVGEHQARMEKVYAEHTRETDTLRQLHSQEVEELRQQNRHQLEDSRKTMQQQLDSMRDSTSHTQSLKAVVERVGLVGDQINTLQGRVSEQHQSQLDNRLQEAREKEEETKRMRRRLEEQEETMGLERERLQATVSRLEAHIKEQNIQLDEEKWRMRQEQNKLSSLQKMVEEERKVMTEQLASQQMSLQQAKNSVLSEQQSIMGQCMEERKALATERAQFVATRREWEAKMKEEMSKSSQDQAVREGTLASLSAERAQLTAARDSLQRDRAMLDQEKLSLEKQQQEAEVERGRLQRLGDSLQQRSRELQGMVGDAVGVREEGEAALVKARKVEGQHATRLQAIERQLEELRATERRIAEDRLQLAEDQKALETSAGSLVCRQCGTGLSRQTLQGSGPYLAPPFNPFPLPTGPELGGGGGGGGGGGRVTFSTPYKGGEPMPSTMVDSLLAQAELDRTRNVWKLAADKDKEFLDEETSFLESLNNSHRLGHPGVM